MHVCPAKVNLTLAVGRPRAQDGYHPICSWMAAISLQDDLLIERAEGDSEFEIHWADDAPQPSAIDWPIEKDLTFRAHAALQEDAKRKLPVSVRLRKRIPVGAGLGGGSSDAAGMLLALNTVFDLGLSTERLSSIAQKLGSDVAFFIAGFGAAIAKGVGEQLSAAPLTRPLDLALITPPLHCNTAAVYRAFDQTNPEATIDESCVHALSESTMLMDDELFNDLAEAAFAVEPRLREVHQACQVAAARRVHVTGSGAAMFAICRNEAEAHEVAAEIRKRAEVPALAVRTVG